MSLAKRVPKVAWIAAVVVAAHVVVAVVIMSKTPGQVIPHGDQPFIPSEVNFGSGRASVVDPKTGDKVLIREFLVSTEFATPEVENAAVPGTPSGALPTPVQGVPRAQEARDVQPKQGVQGVLGMEDR